MRLVIDPGGVVRARLYGEMIDLSGIGPVSIRRASHVDAGRKEASSYADLSPSGGPTLGPFKLRSQALDAERYWLEANALTAPTTLTPLRSR